MLCICKTAFHKSKTNPNNVSSISISEAYKILNLDTNKKITKDDVNKAYIKIQKKIHPDVSPETSRLSAMVEYRQPARPVPAPRHS